MQAVLDIWALVVLGVVLIVAAIIDVRTGKIPNALTYSAIVLGLLGHTLTGGLHGGDSTRIGLFGSLGGFAAGFLPLLAAWLAGGIGGGDAKLMGAVGALTGWRFAIAAMFYGFAIAAVMALIVLIRRRTLIPTLKRILNFLHLLLAPGRPADPTTEKSAEIPFGLALCIGSAVALVEVITYGPVAKKLFLGI